MSDNLYDYLEGGFRVFGIYGIDSKGACECGNEKCTALFKHPRMSNWQSVPDWSEEQIETFKELGHFDTGYGVLCQGWLIVDVDARNGGVKSFKKLIKDIPEVKEAKFVVNTGSGGGSQHHYFKMREPVALLQSHNDYHGIDFKTSGFVIGAGSMHLSGNPYERERGFPQDVEYAPDKLIELLRKPKHYRVNFDGSDIDISDDQLERVVSFIANDGRDYEKYIRVGMGIHFASGGTRPDLWHDWASKAQDGCYDPSEMEKKWHSFGKGSSLVTFGTLMHWAKEGGYCEDITFVYEGDEFDSVDEGLDVTIIDLKRPPGFVGELTQWINNQCLYPRETLSVATALCAVSCLAGMRHYDEIDDMAPNMIAFCIAGSGTGKEAPSQAFNEILRVAGISAAMHGGLKSEQEILRNLIRHQAAFYNIDELGLVLRKLENASKRGGASYLEGIIGTLMSVYSKSNGFLPITGDLKEEIKEMLLKDLSKVEKRLEDLPADSGSDGNRIKLEAESERIRVALGKIDSGLDSPYLTILGYSTPSTFNDLMTFDQATNGFMARAMIFNDLETNPKRKTGFKKEKMSTQLEQKIRNLYAPGVYDHQGFDRIEFTGEKTKIPTTEDGIELLDKVYEYFYELADLQKRTTGLEAIPRRGYELTSKISIVTAMPAGIRTKDDIMYAFALAKKDVDQKIKLAYSTDKGKDDADGLAAKVLSIVSTEHGETIGVICNRVRNAPKEQVINLVQQMVDKGRLTTVNSKHPRNGKEIIRYFSST